MNITRTISEKVAEKMVAPIGAKILSLIEERTDLANKSVSDTLPKDLKECFEKYKSTFQKASCATLCNGRHEVRVDGLSYFPASTTWYPHVEVGSQIIERIDKLRLKIDKLKEEKEKTYNSIVSTLLSLRTFKRVQEQFSDAYEYLKEYENVSTSIPSLPIDDILSTIKKYK
ncbi:Nmad5 family putative nucleotide modification protein [Bacteroides cellulosilyticus]|uniref:Nucleotide modification associated domain-containing protein n=1 Tax=Bacteroides cellulosilyticus TaxID=246787 RepID=A0A3D6AQ01_9BACE|nr:Nmad5 family putative nucleotide modification protein [Bacteroides cellulosilyticus]KAA5416586.1 hypothetical protein F2Y81_15650 [Bacteroides cellulosilyticus]HCY68808.1 hypothetical protein [Bacteroides cellulosilyticus]